MNKVFLIGNLTRDPETRTTQSGTTVCSFTIAVNRRMKQDGKQDDVQADTTRVFTDSCGREVTVPADVQKVAVSGPLAQMVVFAIAPDKMVGVANAWDETAQAYFDEKYLSLPLSLSHQAFQGPRASELFQELRQYPMQ